MRFAQDLMVYLDRLLKEQLSTLPIALGVKKARHSGEATSSVGVRAEASPVGAEDSLEQSARIEDIAALEEQPAEVEASVGRVMVISPEELLAHLQGRPVILHRLAV